MEADFAIYVKRTGVRECRLEVCIVERGYERSIRIEFVRCFRRRTALRVGQGIADDYLRELRERSRFAVVGINTSLLPPDVKL